MRLFGPQAFPFRTNRRRRFIPSAASTAGIEYERVIFSEVGLDSLNLPGVRHRVRLDHSDFDLDSFSFPASRHRAKLTQTSIDIDSRLGVAIELSRALVSSLGIDSSISSVARFIAKSLASEVDINSSLFPALSRMRLIESELSIADVVGIARDLSREVHTDLDIDSSLSRIAGANQIYARFLLTELDLLDAFDVDQRYVLRYVESTVSLYTALSAARERDRGVTDSLDLYDGVIREVISRLKSILLHDNLILSDEMIVDVEALLKPIGIVMHGLRKSNIVHALRRADIRTRLH